MPTTAKQSKHKIDFRELRHRFGKTQREVACAVGVAQNTVAYWDSGRQPRVEHLPDIAQFFGVTIEELYGLPRP